MASTCTTLFDWSEFDRGGHFPALEAPDLLIDYVRAFLAKAQEAEAGQHEGDHLLVEVDKET